MEGNAFEGALVALRCSGSSTGVDRRLVVNHKDLLTRRPSILFGIDESRDEVLRHSARSLVTWRHAAGVETYAFFESRRGMEPFAATADNEDAVIEMWWPSLDLPVGPPDAAEPGGDRVRLSSGENDQVRRLAQVRTVSVEWLGI